MALSHTEFDRRTNALVKQLKSATYLGDGLSHRPNTYKGPWDAGTDLPDAYAIYVSRQGLPTWKYGCQGDPVIVTMELAVACVTATLADREDMETNVGFLSANVARCLLEVDTLAGDDGWHAGIITGSDAQKYRTPGNSLFEIEVFQFNITFEVQP